MSAAATLHATTVAAYGVSGWRAALLRGPSGAGKSDLALRAMLAGFRLVADDRTLAWASAGAVYASAPPTIAGLVEARGLGVLPAPTLAMARVVLVVDLGRPAERMPPLETVSIDGVAVRRIVLDPFEPSAPAKLELALQAATLGAWPEPAYLAPLADETKASDATEGPLKRIR